MKLLVIGSDRNLFKKDSDIWNRYLDYGKLFKEIHIIVFSHRKLSNKDIKIGDNVFVYSTDHIFKSFYLWNIYKISKKILKSVPLSVDSHSWVVSSQDPFESGLAAWMIKKIYKISLQIQIHTDLFSPYFAKESFMNKLRVLLAKFLLVRADGIRVVSERIKNSLITSGYSSNNIAVLPIFVDTEAIKSAPIKIDLHKKYSQFNFIILMASRLTKEKNIGLAIEAMAGLAEKYRKIGLVVTGDGPELGSLQAKAKELKVAENVVFVGWTDDLPSLYKTSDLFLLTSNYEGYGRTIIEAMVAGLPVVTTDVGLAGEVLKNKESGIVILVGDKKALMAAIENSILNKEELSHIGRNAVGVTENLMIKEQYLELYRKITESINYGK